jgi:hypothetical protein
MENVNKLASNPANLEEVKNVSSLGLSLPKNCVSGDEVLVAMKAYCDGSGSFESSKFVVLAGVAASEGVWAGFEENWNGILNARSPVAPYLHMKEIAAASGPFSDERGWTDLKRQQLLTDCLVYVQHLDKKLFRTFICSIDMQKYRTLVSEGKLLPSAVKICNHNVPQRIFGWYLKNFEQWISREIYYFFDQNERYKGPFENHVRKQKKLSRVSNAWHMIRSVTSVDMRFYTPLQLADLIAWAHQRKLNGDPDAKWASLHKFTDAILPFTRMDVAANQLELMAEVSAFGIDPLEI